MTITQIQAFESDIEEIGTLAFARMLALKPKYAVLVYVDGDGYVRTHRIRATIEQAVCLMEAAKQTEMNCWGQKIE